MGPINSLTFGIFYFAPTLIGWFRVRQGKPIVGTLKQLFFFNLLVGWTGVGWILFMANAFGYNPVPWMALRIAKMLPAGPAGNMPQGMPSSSGNAAACSQCGGSGSMMCSACGGRGSWYEAPQGATGTAQLMTCTACVSSGRIRCPYCGGSGHTA